MLFLKHLVFKSSFSIITIKLLKKNHKSWRLYKVYAPIYKEEL